MRNHICYLSNLASCDARKWTWTSSKSRKFFPIVEFFPSHPPNLLKLRSPCKPSKSVSKKTSWFTQTYKIGTIIDSQKPEDRKINKHYISPIMARSKRSYFLHREFSPKCRILYWIGSHHYQVYLPLGWISYRNAPTKAGYSNFS